MSPLQLRVPPSVIVAFALPAAFFWALAGWVVVEGDSLNILVVIPVVWTGWLVLLARAGAVVDSRGLRLRTFGRGRWIPWAEVEDFDLRRRGRTEELHVRTTSGELVRLFGLPSRSYRRQNGWPLRGIAARLLADLRSRHEAARESMG